MTTPRRPWPVRLLGWTIPTAYRDEIVNDLVDERGSNARLCLDLLQSAIDGRRHAWLERRQRRAAIGGGFGTSFPSDLRSAWRQHIAHPAGTASSVLTIALAVGVNTALVSVAHGVLFKPLPFRDPSHVIFVW